MYKKLSSFNVVLRTTIMTHVKPQISKFKSEKSCQVGLTCYGGCIHERLLSESSRSYMLAYYLSVFVLQATVLFTFSTDQPRFTFSPNSPLTISTDDVLLSNEMLTRTNDLTRLKKRSLVQPP